MICGIQSFQHAKTLRKWLQSLSQKNETHTRLNFVSISNFKFQERPSTFWSIVFLRWINIQSIYRSFLIYTCSTKIAYMTSVYRRISYYIFFHHPYGRWLWWWLASRAFASASGSMAKTYRRRFDQFEWGSSLSGLAIVMQHCYLMSLNLKTPCTNILPQTTPAGFWGHQSKQLQPWREARRGTYHQIYDPTSGATLLQILGGLHAVGCVGSSSPRGMFGENQIRTIRFSALFA